MSKNLINNLEDYENNSDFEKIKSKPKLNNKIKEKTKKHRTKKITLEEN